MDRPIPRDTREAFTPTQYVSPSLVWDKLLQPDGPGGDDYKVVVPDRGLPCAPIKEVQAMAKRRRAYVDQTRAGGRHVTDFDARVEFRLAVGFGAEHVTETNVRLERLRGFPIIPGSACKGLARTVAIMEVAQALRIAAAPPDQWQPASPGAPLPDTPLRLLSELLETPSPAAEQPANDPMTAALSRLHGAVPDMPIEPQVWLQRSDVTRFRAVFGARDRSGQVVFLDAIPKSTAGTEVDIITPHFGEYYGDKNARTPPSDTGRPIPTRFLVVPAGVEFTFALTSRSSEALEVAVAWLRRGLSELGVGAKTAAGYGFFALG